MADIETRLNTDIAHLSFLLNGHIGCDWRTGRPFTLHTKSDGDFYELQRALAALQDARAEISSLRQKLETARADVRKVFDRPAYMTAVSGVDAPYLKIEFKTLAELQDFHAALRALSTSARSLKSGEPTP